LFKGRYELSSLFYFVSMKSLLIAIFFVSAFFLKASPPGFIHVENGKVVWPDGSVAKLNGVNLGGWLLWEGWIWGGGFNKEAKVYSKIEEVVGKEEAKKFKDAIHRKFITEKDIEEISKLCFNVVRVPVNHTLLEDDSLPYHYKESGWKILDSLLGWCDKYQVYVVLDLHAAPGGQNNFFISDPDKINLWESPENKKRTVALWKAIAQRYSWRTSIAAYDLLNEPSLKNPHELAKLYNEITLAIRSADPNHMIMLEGNKLATDFSFFNSLSDSNSIFSFHFYTFLVKQHEKRLSEFQLVAEKFKRPLWCGEWGENTLEKLKTDKGFLEDPEYNFCGICAWTWKRVEKDVNKPALIKIVASSNWTKLMKFTTGLGAKPDKESALKGMKDFLNALGTVEPSKAMVDLLQSCK
jgi:endoglucanase